MVNAPDVAAAPDAATAAATWWTAVIGSPTFTLTDHATRTRESDMTAVAGSVLYAIRPVPTEDTARGFQAMLTDRVAAELDRLERVNVCYLHLSTDLYPQETLRDVADAARVGGFPTKTLMAVQRDVVTVSAGYQAETVILWQSPTWQRPVCGAQKFTHGERMPWACSLPLFHATEGQAKHQFDRPDPLCSQCGRDAGHKWHQPGHWGGSHDFEAGAVQQCVTCRREPTVTAKLDPVQGTDHEHVFRPVRGTELPA